ncbi:MAG: iron-containing alcohol dehydrogenase [Candidatus Hodarchaeota archaeon]
MWYFRSPRLIVFGEGALDHLKELEGNRVFIVTDQTIVKLGFLDQVIEKLKASGKEVAFYDKVPPEPPDEIAQDCAHVLRKFDPDIIMGIGGGSVLDVAKVARILNEHPDHPIIDITPLTPIAVSKTQLITIPTTSGTGSDATWAAVITDTQDGNKMELTHPELVPFISILDPALTKSMPPKVTASTGMDAIAQAIDGYTVQWRNDFSDGLAIHATRLLFKYLPRAFEKPNDMEAREKVQNAATISGLAWSNSFLGITHSFGHAMGAVFKIPHGITVGMVLPYSIEYAKKTHAALYGELSRAVGVATKDDDNDTATMKLRDAVFKLMEGLQVPTSLKEYGISKEEFEKAYDDLVRFTQESAVNIFNCREPTNEDIERFWHYMFEGKSIDF